MTKEKKPVTVEKLLYSVREFAAMCGIHESEAYRRFAAGDVDTVKIGRRKLVRREAIEKFIDKCAA